MVILTVVFGAGIFLGRQIDIPFIRLYLIAIFILIFSIAVERKRLICEVVIVLLAFLLGMLLLKNQRTLEADHVLRFIYFKSQYRCLVKGYIYDQPQNDGQQRIKFIFRPEEIQFGKNNYQCRGYILVYSKYNQN